MKQLWEQIKHRKAALLTTVTALLLCAALTAETVGGRALLTAGQITNWGLSFQKEGEPPVANVTAEYLDRFGALYRVPTDEKILYLTFDAGYENGCTGQILDALQKHNAKAVFFLVGNYLEQEPDLVRRMAAEGHTVGNHTYSHPDMSAIADEASFRNELEKNAALYRQVTGEDMPGLYRPPQGKFCESNLKLAQELGYRTVFWSLAYVDWYENAQPTREEAFRKLLPRVHPGAVVLLHSTSKTNGAILDELLTRWEELGYTFGDLGEYLQETAK